MANLQLGGTLFEKRSVLVACVCKVLRLAGALQVWLDGT